MQINDDSIVMHFRLHYIYTLVHSFVNLPKMCGFSHKQAHMLEVKQYTTVKLQVSLMCMAIDFNFENCTRNCSLLHKFMPSVDLLQ